MLAVAMSVMEQKDIMANPLDPSNRGSILWFQDMDPVVYIVSSQTPPTHEIHRCFGSGCGI